MIDRTQAIIRRKALSDAPMPNQLSIPRNFGKIKIGLKNLDDAVYTLNNYARLNSSLGDRKSVLDAINTGNISRMRDISNFFYKTSGIYARLCRYMAYLYKYDWFITPYIAGCEGLVDSDSGISSVDTDKDIKEKKKVFNAFFKVLSYFESFEVKRFFGQVALKVIRNGCYYGYLIPTSTTMLVQELDPAYCRSRFKMGNRPAIEFNMKYFDDKFSDTTLRERMLSFYPKDFKKGYQLYKQGKLEPAYPGDDRGWYLLDPKFAIKFNINDEDFPAFIAVIPALIDLDAAQEIDKKRMAQKLLKIIIQKLPIDKNGDLVFDTDEAVQLHNNAVAMLKKAIGIDVLTTFADVDVADMSDKTGNTVNADDVSKVERSVFNEAGVSQLQFNSDGNIALNNSILNDEASMYNLLVQFEAFLNQLLEQFNKSPKRIFFRAQILTTTIYNYKEMAKLYKEQAQMGYSKMLPQIALGQTQSSVLANAYFENDILDLVRVFVPPLTSNVMNAEALQAAGARGKDAQQEGQTKQAGAGRPEKDDNEKAQKTIQNRQSM